jgi:hypothetical protein
MRIESFWAKGYRSLRDVRLENLGPFNVFYGPNGAGKSNILDGIRTLFGLTRRVGSGSGSKAMRDAGTKVTKSGFITRDDLCVHQKTRTLVLGAYLKGSLDPFAQLSSGPLTLPDLALEVTLNWAIEAQPELHLSALRTGSEDLLEFFMGGPPPEIYVGLPERRLTPEDRAYLQSLLMEVLPSRVYTRVSADRHPRPEAKDDEIRTRNLVAYHLHAGNLKSALLAAQIGPSAHVRRRLEALRSLLAGEPLYRPPFDPIQDPATGTIDLRERLPDPNPEGVEIPIDLAGLGIAQIYAILAKAMLMGTAAVGIEEPEAHLHAPTSGRALRRLLVRLVEEKFIDQLFIATHSNLFDLDPTGYFDVSIKDGCTVIARSDLTRIDREHLYEPGPAKHALEKLLQYAPEDEIVFRRSDGTGVTAKEMMRLLQEDDALAVRFLEDVHGAAVRMVKIQSKKSA